MKIKINMVFIEVTCPHCQSVLQVFEKDIEVDFHFGHGTYITALCAACHKIIPLKEEQLRTEWAHLLQNPDNDD